MLVVIWEANCNMLQQDLTEMSISKTTVQYVISLFVSFRVLLPPSGPKSLNAALIQSVCFHVKARALFIMFNCL